MWFGVEFIPSEDIDHIVAYARLTEMSEIDYIWVTDHYTNRDPFVTLTTIAQATSRVRLGPGATNPYTRRPAVIASGIASIDEISYGRAVLGITSGDPSILHALGIEIKRPLRMIRDSVNIIRSLLRGETVNYESEFFKYNNARLHFKPKNKIPIYIGGMGPKMLELAGEIGEGVLINASHPEDIHLARKAIKKGMEKANRSSLEMDIASYSCFSIDRNLKKAQNAAKRVLPFIVAGAPRIVTERHGLPSEDVTLVRDSLWSGNYKKAVESITDGMIEAFSICGTPNEVVMKIEEFINIGVTQIIVGSPIGPVQRDSIDLLRKIVIPKVGK
ncbi:MAG: 5,10-methylenetetrahydromethanopterin reductase [Candidatus Hydrothermarchaeota archaeon]|nr:5,10-methylenetetrahydromethanopterin reductase [Candidatus Hydrothermarchaeota archaeon]